MRFFLYTLLALSTQPALAADKATVNAAAAKMIAVSDGKASFPMYQDTTGQHTGVLTTWSSLMMSCKAFPEGVAVIYAVLVQGPALGEMMTVSANVPSTTGNGLTLTLGATDLDGNGTVDQAIGDHGGKLSLPAAQAIYDAAMTCAASGSK